MKNSNRTHQIYWLPLACVVVLFIFGCTSHQPGCLSLLGTDPNLTASEHCVAYSSFQEAERMNTLQFLKAKNDAENLGIDYIPLISTALNTQRYDEFEFCFLIFGEPPSDRLVNQIHKLGTKFRSCSATTARMDVDLIERVTANNYRVYVSGSFCPDFSCGNGGWYYLVRTDHGYKFDKYEMVWSR